MAAAWQPPAFAQRRVGRLQRARGVQRGLAVADQVDAHRALGVTTRRGHFITAA